MRRLELPEAITTTGVIAVARKIDPARLPAVATALAAGGVEAIEVTLDGVGALGSIESLAGGAQLVGAGTVMTVEEARNAVDAGAAFIVSPHTDPAIVSWAVEREIPVMAGAFTPTEVVTAWTMGVSAVKVFPASVGGPGLVQALRGPLDDVLLVPTGGIDDTNARDFMVSGSVAVGAGGWLTAHSDPAEITTRARKLVAACSL